MDLDFLTHAPFWVALGQIIIIDILLGGDNAVVIALACRKLPPAQRKKGIIWGTVGAILLIWIGIKLIAPDDEGHDNIEGSDKLFAAIKTIIVADLVMSVDNVIAIAGAAQSSGDHQMLLIVLGLLISVPIIVWGSQLVIKLMERFPMIIVAGGMLLGWIAGGMFVTDPVFVNTDKWLWMPKLGTTDAQGLAEISKTLYWAAHIGGALLVLALGKFIASRRPAVAAH